MKNDKIIYDTFDLLSDKIVALHIKDFVCREGKLVSVAAGTGQMNYENLLRMVKARKPFIQATLENTTNENAVQARQLIQEIYQKV